jgi:ABC-2 type transport system ATP-binding protein
MELSPAADLAVDIRGLRKRYGRRFALNGLDLTVSRGEIFGFLGPNGAGKSTTIRVLLGLIRPTAGAASVFGRRAGTVHSRQNGRIGALVEGPAFYEYLSGRRNLELLARLSGRVDQRRVSEVLDLVGLADRARDRVRTYSHGMKQRLGIAQALIPRPELLILDEPASGLDPQGLVEVRDLLQRVNAEEGVTVFLSSHYLHEVEMICTDAAIISKGRIVRRDKVANLLRAPETSVLVSVDDLPRGLELLRGLPFVSSAETSDGCLRAVCSPDAIADINAALVHAGLRVSALERQRQTLEELYMQLMQ